MPGLGDWEKLSKTLDDDLMLIYPGMYLENEHLFDQIMGIGYLIKDLSHPDSGLDWVRESRLIDTLRKHPKTAVISKLLIVRLRLPWSEVNTEFLITEQMFRESPEEYDVLEIFLYLRDIESNEKAFWALSPEKKLEFESNRDRYEVLEKRYSVRWKWSDEEIEKLLNESLITENSVHTYMAQ